MSEAIKIRDLDRMYLRVNGESLCLTDLPWDTVESWARDSLAKRPTAEAREDFLLAIARHLHERLRYFGDHFDVVPSE